MRKILFRQGLTIFSFLLIQISAIATNYPISVTFSGSQEVPSNGSSGTGTFIGTYNDVTDSLIYTVTFSGLSSNTTAAHFHASPPGISGPVIIAPSGIPFPLGITSGSFTDTLVLTAGQEDSLKRGLYYFNIHTTNFPGGELRAQLFLQNASFVIPDITCPADTTVAAAAGGCTASVSFAADTNTAVPTAALFYRIRNTAITSPYVFPLGVTIVTATALNAAGYDTCRFTVTVRDTTRPVITCPANIVRSNDPGVCGATVSFQATATDLCSSVTITYSQNPGTFFPVGVTTVTATARDSSGNTSSCSFTVTVNDVEPPVIHDLLTSRQLLWPPNHRMKDITVSYTSTDNCPGQINCSLTVTSNEAQNGTGDGDTSPDWEVVNDHLVRLRAERAGTGNGRVYTIVVACVDQHGNIGRDTTKVRVPKNMGIQRGLHLALGQGHGTGNPHKNSAVTEDESYLEYSTYVTIYPSPTENYFTINIQSVDNTSKLSVRIFDIAGRVLEMRENLAGNQTIRMGEKLKAGIYIAEVRQGNQTKQIKLIKQ